MEATVCTLPRRGVEAAVWVASIDVHTQEKPCATRRNSATGETQGSKWGRRGNAQTRGLGDLSEARRRGTCGPASASQGLNLDIHGDSSPELLMRRLCLTGFLTLADPCPLHDMMSVPEGALVSWPPNWAYIRASMLSGCCQETSFKPLWLIMTRMDAPAPDPLFAIAST